ncbi:TPA: hypothetical protein DHW58_01305 [Patescibacteria group bacterium]|nr:hypothetical protein [Patescibacteria group bacterium]
MLKNPTMWFLIGAIIIIALLANWMGLLPKINLVPAQPSLATSNNYIPPAAPATASSSNSQGFFVESERGKALLPTAKDGKARLQGEFTEFWGKPEAEINIVAREFDVFARPAVSLGMIFGVREIEFFPLDRSSGTTNFVQYLGDTKQGSAQFHVSLSPGKYLLRNYYDPNSFFLLEVS